MMMLGDELAEATAEESTMAVAEKLHYIESTRYLYRGTYRKKNDDRIKMIGDWRKALDNDSYLSDDAFRLYFRMNRDSFRDLLALLESNTRFQSPGKKQPAPIGLQVMVFLYYLGTSGNASNPNRIADFLVFRRDPLSTILTELPWFCVT